MSRTNLKTLSSGIVFAWDLDGVIRNLSGTIYGQDPDIWDYEVDGKDIFKIVAGNMSILETAKPTLYYPLAMSYSPLIIISSQPENWRPYTIRWLKKYFPAHKVYYQFVDSFKEKEKILRKNDNIFLIDDYPYFEDYSKIVLIDHKYNRNVKNPFKRITTPEQLKELIFN